MASDCLLVNTTIGNRERAEKLADQLVNERLAACVSIGASVTSFYRWEGEVVKDEEWPLLIKTGRAKQEELTRWLEANHPYDCPEILVRSVDDCSADYENWLMSNLG